MTNYNKFQTPGARPLCHRAKAGLIAGLLVALGTITNTQPAAAQGGKVEKPNITFGVFPITNYGVVYVVAPERPDTVTGLRELR